MSVCRCSPHSWDKDGNPQGWWPRGSRRYGDFISGTPDYSTTAGVRLFCGIDNAVPVGAPERVCGV